MCVKYVECLSWKRLGKLCGNLPLWQRSKRYQLASRAWQRDFNSCPLSQVSAWGIDIFICDNSTILELSLIILKFNSFDSSNRTFEGALVSSAPESSSGDLTSMRLPVMHWQLSVCIRGWYSISMHLLRCRRTCHPNPREIGSLSHLKNAMLQLRRQAKASSDKLDEFAWCWLEAMEDHVHHIFGNL